MKLEITTKAYEKLQPYVDADTCLLLDLDDGVGEFSKFGICSLDTSFRFLVVKKDSNLKDYNTLLDSGLGTIYLKDYTLHYLGEKPVIDVNERFQSLTLASESGMVDGNVPIVDMRALQEL